MPSTLQSTPAGAERREHTPADRDRELVDLLRSAHDGDDRALREAEAADMSVLVSHLRTRLAEIARERTGH